MVSVLVVVVAAVVVVVVVVYINADDVKTIRIKIRQLSTVEDDDPH